MLHHGPAISISLAAIVRNWQLLKGHFSGPDCAAVVKANAYGLGAHRVASALHHAGCATFFVATLDEAVSLRVVLPDAAIYVFHGIAPKEAEHFVAHAIRPVLNDRGQVEQWAKEGQGNPAALHVDTGMCRLGLTPGEARALDPALLSACQIDLLMSHLACGGEPEHPLNAAQLTAMRGLADFLPEVPRSLCNSSGIFLGEAFHFQTARPGCSLYGITPRGLTDNPMKSVAVLSAPILQLRDIREAQPVGYGATYTTPAGSLLATVELGYADGFHRILTGHSFAYIGDRRLPVVGRVSMDMVMVDVTSVPGVKPGDRVEFIGPHQTVDALATQAQTIGYEIFTSLGPRIRRIYVEDGQGG